MSNRLDRDPANPPAPPAGWAREQSIQLRDLARSAMYAALTGVGAWVAIPLAVVPVTLQVFFVYLSGLVLRPYYALFAMVIYLVIGLMGLPVFAQGGSGLGVVLGPTGGYLFGFILAAFLLSVLVDPFRRKAATRGRPALYALCLGPLVVASVVILGCGALWGKFSAGVPWWTILTGWVLPFLPGDVFKIVMAIVVGVEVWKRNLQVAPHD